jgi:phosphoserine phosphatase
VTGETAQPPGTPPKGEVVDRAAETLGKSAIQRTPQHLLLFHEDPPTEWLKTVALECGARGLDRLGNVGFRLLWVQRPERAAEVVQTSAPEGYDWALVPAERKVSDFGMLVCDMDATLIENECVDELAALLPDPAPVIALTALAMEGRIPVEESLRKRIDAIGGMPERAIRAILAQRIVMRPGTERLMRLARTAGWPIVLATGGFAQFAEPIADRLGIKELLCNRLEIEDERLKGTFSGDIVDAPSKALAVANVAKRLGLKMRQMIALGDGANDSVLLRNAGMGIGIRPKPVIAEIATHSLYHAPLDAVWYLAGGE